MNADISDAMHSEYCMWYLLVYCSLAVHEILSALECEDDSDYAENLIYVDPPIRAPINSQIKTVINLMRSMKQTQNHLGPNLLPSRCEMCRVRSDSDDIPQHLWAFVRIDTIYLESIHRVAKAKMTSHFLRWYLVVSCLQVLLCLPKKKKTTLWKKQNSTFTCT